MEQIISKRGIVTFVILRRRSGGRECIDIFKAMFIISAAVIRWDGYWNLGGHGPFQGGIDGGTVIERLGGRGRRAGTGGEGGRIGLSSGRHVTLRRRWWVWGRSGRSCLHGGRSSRGRLDGWRSRL